MTAITVKTPTFQDIAVFITGIVQLSLPQEQENSFSIRPAE